VAIWQSFAKTCKVSRSSFCLAFLFFCDFSLRGFASLRNSAEQLLNGPPKLNQFKFLSFFAWYIYSMNSNIMDARRTTAVQLFLRLAISISFLSAVADRLGMWGAPGTAGVSWGNWENFVAYSRQVNSFVGAGANDWLAIIATVLETLLALLLLMGYRTRLIAIASGILLVGFALAMTYSFGIKSSLDYSVWTAAAASFALSGLGGYRYSVDDLIGKR
jgi:uncharacterized membrane protein YphA (DoxX/SURF4 family)